VRRLVSGLLAILAIVTGCATPVDGTARVGSREVDPAAFFAGPVPTYGLPVSAGDVEARDPPHRPVRPADPRGSREDR
jgi:hypothetical protein